MKNFKSLLSLLIALTMLFSCFAAFAADTTTTTTTDTTATTTTDTSSTTTTTDTSATTTTDEVTQTVTSFSDVDAKSTVGKAVSELALLGIITGYPDGTFLPDGNITRAEFAAVCVRLANLANGIGTDAVTGFSDLDSDDSYKWARPYVMMAKGAGIINGYEDGTFRAGNPVTYEEAVKMLMCLKGWGSSCEAQNTLVAGSRWSYGYIKLANQQGLTKNTNSNEVYQTQPTTRGTVAILANNSRTMKTLVTTVNTTTGKTVTEADDSNSGSGTSGSNNEIVSGVITGTYLTRIETPEDEDEDYDLERYEIMIGDEIYEVDQDVLDEFDLYDLLGQKVKVTYNNRNDEITKIAVQDTDTTKIYTAYSGEDTNFIVSIDDGKVAYTNNISTFRTKEISLSGSIVFNGKLVDDFKTADLADSESQYYLTDGVIEILDNGGYEVTKISSYESYVAAGSVNTSKDTLSVLYHESTDRTIDAPKEDDADYFVLRNSSNGADTTTSTISKFTVLDILESPSGTDGPSIKIVEVTKNSKTSQTVDKVNDDDVRIFSLGGTYYQYSNTYWNTKEKLDNEEITLSDDMPELKKDDAGVNVYLNCLGQVAAVSSSSSTSISSYNYGYLLNYRQDDEQDYDLELYILKSDGTKVSHGTANKITIDGESYKTSDNDIPDLLAEGAQLASEAYLANLPSGAEVTNLTVQQPIRYKLDAKSRVTALDTVREGDDEDDDALKCEVPYSGAITYSSSSGFNGSDADNKFSYSSTGTKVFYVPDDRSDYDSYALLSSAFTGGRKYNVEAYNRNTSTQKRADLILVYHTNDSISFNYKSPFFIVTKVPDTDDDDDMTLTGYLCKTASVATSTSTYKIDTTKLSSSARAALDNIGKGDIVRFLTESQTKLDEDGTSKKVTYITDLEVWLDASDPTQNESVDSRDDALASRILAMRSDGSDVSGDYYQASFRLAYGTVLAHDDEDKVLTVTPSVAGDGLELLTSGTGVVSHKYSTTTKVFRYNGKDGVEYIKEDGFNEIYSYDDAGDSATIVVTYTTGDSTSSASNLRFVYIIQ